MARRWYRDEGLRATTFMTLSSIPRKKLVEFKVTAIEGPPVMSSRDRFLDPAQSRHSAGGRSRAARSSLELGVGGCSSSSSTRRLSRRDRINRSSRSMTARAACSAFRTTKAVRSTCSIAAAWQWLISHRR